MLQRQQLPLRHHPRRCVPASSGGRGSRRVWRNCTPCSASITSALRREETWTVECQTTDHFSYNRLQAKKLFRAFCLQTPAFKWLHDRNKKEISRSQSPVAESAAFQAQGEVRELSGSRITIDFVFTSVRLLLSTSDGFAAGACAGAEWRGLAVAALPLWQRSGVRR